MLVSNIILWLCITLTIAQLASGDGQNLVILQFCIFFYCLLPPFAPVARCFRIFHRGDAKDLFTIASFTQDLESGNSLTHRRSKYLLKQIKKMLESQMNLSEEHKKALIAWLQTEDTSDDEEIEQLVAECMSLIGETWTRELNNIFLL